MMSKGIARIAGLVLGLIAALPLYNYAQSHTSEELQQEWFLKDPEKDQVQGVSADRVYNTLLKDKPSRTVLVAVIDSGIDIEHEDLTDIIWVNEDEIPGNGIDDDKNGYVDDIHGWNFLGSKDGTNIDGDTYELTREYVRLRPVFENADEKTIRKNKKDYEYWLAIKDKFKADSTK